MNDFSFFIAFASPSGILTAFPESTEVFLNLSKDINKLQSDLWTDIKKD